MNYQILLAEDEEDVRRIIGQHINESDTPFEVIGEAADGVEAIEMMRALNPDILITDVCMPHLNGLEMLKSIREFNADIPTVIISGYDEFSYVKEAMRLGVREYLLKPFLPGELFEVLEKIRRGLEQQKQLERNLEGMNRRLEQTEELSRELSKEHLMRIVLEGGDQEEAKSCACQVGFPWKAHCYAVGIMHVAVMNGGVDAEVSDQSLQKYLDIVKDNYFSPELSLMEARYGMHQIVLFFAGEKTGAAEFVRLIQSGMEKTARSMERYHGIKTQCTLGNVYRDTDGLKPSYQEALDTRKKMDSPDQVFLNYRDARVRDRACGEPEQLYGKRIGELQEYLLFYVETDHLQGALEELDKLFAVYGEFPMEQSEYVSVSLLKLVLKLSDLVSKAGGRSQAWEDERIVTFLKTHFQYGSLQEARSVLTEYIRTCCSQLPHNYETQGDRLISEARAVIQKNLSNETFGLDQLAEMLHFSSNYVRQVFKARSGENFTDYLFRSRMELAGKLLLDPSSKVQDVAAATGYSNQRYFARCFKKYFSCTPTEYKERGGVGTEKVTNTGMGD